MIQFWSRLTLRWSQLVFREHYERITPHIRAMRLLEEAIELAQSEEVSIGEVEYIVRQVYRKLPGDPYKELGGVLCSLAAYAGLKSYSLEHCFIDEFERIMHPTMMEKVRNRNLSGDKIGLQEPIKFIKQGNDINGDTGL